MLKGRKLFENFQANLNMRIKESYFSTYNKDKKPINKKISPIKEKYIYIMTDKHSVKPDKEIKITKQLDLMRKNDETNTNLMENSHNNEYIYQKTFMNGHHNHLSGIKSNIWKKMNETFMPREYPSSVKAGYSHFTKFSFIQNVCLYIMNFISTQVLISSLNLGISRNSSLFMSAGLNWVVKDYAGQIGNILFSAYFSRDIEKNLKRWRVLSLLMCNFGILLEISTILQPQNFLYIASLGTVCK